MIKLMMFAALASGALAASPASAQDDGDHAKEPRRVRIGLGAQIVPRFPGSDESSIKPYWDIAITRGDKPFEFEAADESFGFPLIRASGFEIGPAANVENSRRRRHVGAAVDEVGATIEAGAFAQYWFTDSFRIRAEGRQGVNGHRSLVGSVGADLVLRDGDKYVFSIGPRVSLSDRGYQTAYFGVNPAAAARTGLAAYRPGSGVHALGATSGATYALSARWGLIGYVKYDRLVGDAGRSPLVRAFGKRDQLSGGLGLTYTFGKNVR